MKNQKIYRLKNQHGHYVTKALSPNELNCESWSLKFDDFLFQTPSFTNAVFQAQLLPFQIWVYENCSTQTGAGGIAVKNVPSWEQLVVANLNTLPLKRIHQFLFDDQIGWLNFEDASVVNTSNILTNEMLTYLTENIEFFNDPVELNVHVRNAYQNLTTEEIQDLKIVNATTIVSLVEEYCLIVRNSIQPTAWPEGEVITENPTISVSEIIEKFNRKNN